MATTTKPTILESDPQDVLMDLTTGDVVVDEQGLHFVSGLQAVAQGCRIRMLMYLGEWALNMDIGIPYYEFVFGENYNEPAAKAAFTAAILSTPGVTEVVSLTLTPNDDTRKLQITWIARSLFGDTPEDLLEV